MTHLGYLLVGWGVSLGCGVLYATRLMLRGRRLSAAVPAGQRRWLTSNDKAGSAGSEASEEPQAADAEAGP